MIATPRTERSPKRPDPRTRALVAVSRALARLPLPVLHALGAGLGRLAWWLLPARRRVTRHNIDACFPELEPAARRRLARASMIELGRGFADSLVAWYGPSRAFAGRVEITGLEHLETAEGAQLVVMAHFPCVELACRALNEAVSRPGAIVARRHRQPWLEAWVDRGRCRYATETIAKKDLRRMLRLLRVGGRLLYGPDQNFTYQSVFAPFFGVPAATLTATADIAARTGAQVLSAWAWRTGSGRYRMRIDPPWEGFPSGDAVGDATRINAWMEARIREAPAQYLWVHRRFRTRPPGEAPFYPPRARRRKHR